MKNMEEKYYITGVKLKKSLNFLYPLLGFSEKEVPATKDSFLYWTEVDNNIEDYNLIVYFKTEDDEKFKEFERDKILIKDNLLSCYKVEEGFVYIFDLAMYAEDIAEFLQGNYSKFRMETKNKILKHFDNEKDKTVRPGRPHHMALFPLLYKSVVSEELGVDEDDLKELFNKYDIEEEICNLNIAEDCECKPEKVTYYFS